MPFGLKCDARVTTQLCEGLLTPHYIQNCGWGQSEGAGRLRPSVVTQRHARLYQGLKVGMVQVDVTIREAGSTPAASP